MDKYTERVLRWYASQCKQHKTAAYAIGNGKMLLVGPTAAYMIPWDLDISLHVKDWSRDIPKLYTQQMICGAFHKPLMVEKVEHIMIGFRERVVAVLINAEPDSNDPIIRRVMRSDIQRAQTLIKWFAESPAKNIVAYDADGEPLAMFAQIVRR